MKSQFVKLVTMLLGLAVIGSVLLGQLTAATANPFTDTALQSLSAEPVPTQPLPPAVEKGANWPLVCGGVVLLVIIIGGVAWNFRFKKSSMADH